jgi:hypothetical protein
VSTHRESRALRAWRKRAEAVDGVLAPAPSPVLTASEIGSFMFCPQAWYLERCRVPPTPEAQLRQEVGRRTHKEIGRQTDLVRAASAAQRLLLLAIGLLLLLLVALALRGLG